MDVKRFLEKADAAQRRAPEQAIALYRQVLLAAPDHAAARGGLLAAYRRRVELRGGPSLLDRAAAKSFHAAALGLRGSKRWAAMARSCDAALEKSPGDEAILALLAESLEAQDRAEAALACWQAAIAANEKSVVALKNAGRLHYQLKQVDEAIACLESAHALDRHDPDVERMRRDLAAEGTLARTRYDTAASSRELIKDPEALRRAESAGRLHRTEAEREAQAGELRERLATSPGDGDLRRRLVQALVSGGRHAEALAVLDEVLAAAPDDPAWLDRRGEVALAAGETALRAAQAAGDEEAVARLRAERLALEIGEGERRVRRSPGDAGLRVRLARALYRAGRTDQAIEHFQAAMADPRHRLETQQGLGACFFRKGHYPLAARQFEGALQAAGGVSGDRGKEICYHLALVAERMNDRPAALARYLAIYEVDIGFRDVARKIEDLQT